MNSPLIEKQSAPQANSFHMIRSLGGVGIVCSLLIVFVYQYTKPIIEAKKALALEKAIYQVLPGTTNKVTFDLQADNSFVKIEGQGASGQRIFAGFNDQGQLVGFAIEASGNGFQDLIKLIYGYSHEKQAIVGFQVLESKETPGLGDKIEKDVHFLDNFKNLDVTVQPETFAIQNPVKLVKPGKKTEPWQIDAITGATISSKAVCRILENSSNYWMPLIQEHINEIKDQAQ